jgi:hypothetical protein
MATATRLTLTAMATRPIPTAMVIQRTLIATATRPIAMATMAVTDVMQAIEPPDALRSIVPAGTEARDTAKSVLVQWLRGRARQGVEDVRLRGYDEPVRLPSSDLPHPLRAARQPK